MKGRIWQRLDRLSGWGCILALFCLLVVMASLEVKDLDLWLHLKTGQYILQNRVIPHQDNFFFNWQFHPASDGICLNIIKHAFKRLWASKKCNHFFLNTKLAVERLE